MDPDQQFELFPDGDDPSNYLDAIAAEFRSNLIRFDAGGDLLIVKNDAMDGESPEHRVALGSRLLPATSLLPGPRRFRDEPELMRAIALACDEALYDGSGDAKKQQSPAATTVSTLAKLVECMWLKGLYRFADLDSSFFTWLGVELSKNKWAPLVRLEERSQAAVAANGFSSDWVRTDNGRGGKNTFSVTAAFVDLVRTNLTGRELAAARRVLAPHMQLPSDPEVVERPSASMMRQWFMAINRLARLPDDVGTKLVPYPELVKTSKDLGKSDGRTVNVPIDVAAPVLRHCLLWVDMRSPDLIAFISNSVHAYPSIGGGRDQRIKTWTGLLASRFLPLMHKWDLPVPPNRSVFDLINECVRALVVACFTTIAGMNARRKDEISHPKFGLKATSMKEVSGTLGLYSAMFYIEKTAKDYVPFYVNHASFHAWNALVQLSKAFQKVDAANNGADIFNIKQFVQQGIAEGKRFDYKTDDLDVKLFVRTAVGSDSALVPPAHGFRRFYAVIFMYRFEDSSLQALSEQLQHLDLETTRVYVVDALSSLRGLPLPIELTSEHRAAREQFLTELADDINQVGKEKLVRTVDQILSGSETAGRFGELVLKLAAKMSANATFSTQTRDARSKSICELLERKGYYVEPFWHGDCMAGDGPGRRGSQCYSTQQKMPLKENASPAICSKCIYHDVQPGHLNSLRHVADEIENTHSGTSVLAQADQERWMSLKRVIAIYERRFE